MNKNSTKKPLIHVEGLTKFFNGTKAVNNLTLKIDSGIIFGFLGANGSGKTTSLRLLSGLLAPDKGQGTCFDLDLITQTKLIQAQLGYMPQQFCLYQNLTVYENLDFIARIYGLKNRVQRLNEICELLKLNEKKNQITCTLSGGWKQRVALAAALLNQPRLLLLDEPTSGIDPHSRLIIWSYIQELVEKGVTVLLSTHHMDEAERCHQLAYMASGNILALGTAAEIIQSTALYSWRIMGKNLDEFKSLCAHSHFPIQLIEKGNEMRISSNRRDLFQQFDSALLKQFEIIDTETTLEDAFIYKIQHEGLTS